MDVKRTGWPPGLLQDDSRQLSKWLANRPGARRIVQQNQLIDLLYTALKDLLEMPEYDGTRATSQVRLRAKNAAKRALKAVEKGEYETDSSFPGRG
jgi:hypothetical protein